jgi:hypothetical protein
MSGTRQCIHKRYIQNRPVKRRRAECQPAATAHTLRRWRIPLLPLLLLLPRHRRREMDRV